MANRRQCDTSALGCREVGHAQNINGYHQQPTEDASQPGEVSSHEVLVSFRDIPVAYLRSRKKAAHVIIEAVAGRVRMPG